MLDEFIHKIVRSAGVRLGVVAAMIVGGAVMWATDYGTMAFWVGSYLVLGGALAATIIHIETFFLGLEQWWKQRGKRSSPPSMRSRIQNGLGVGAVAAVGAIWTAKRFVEPGSIVFTMWDWTARVVALGLVGYVVVALCLALRARWRAE